MGVTVINGPGEGATATDQASRRLRGTIWQHVPSAHAVYRSGLALGAALGRLGVSANALTYMSLVVAGFAGVAAASGHFAAAAVLVVVSGIFDVVDGAVARATNTVSKWGALLDSSVDRLADGLPLVGVIAFYAHSGAVVMLPALAILGAFAVSYVRARAETLGVVLPPLYMRRAERLLLLTLSLLAGAALREGPVPSPLLLLGVSTLGLLSFAGCVSALHAARSALLGASHEQARPLAHGSPRLRHR